MNTATLVLASASPRRRRLISWLGLSATATSADTAEDLTRDLGPTELASFLAAEKALAVRAAGVTAPVLVSFDTIVLDGGAVLGKPVDEADAWRMLRGLAGGTHEVVTGVALLFEGADAPETFAVTTTVSMRTLTDDDIALWVAEGECMGCAGAYNIERHLASVDDGECFQNVAGLPLCHVYRALATAAADGTLDAALASGLTAPVMRCDAALDRSCTLGPVVCGIR